MGIRHTFIQNMKFYRKKAGLTQEKLAEAIGMSTSYIGDMEARERFPSAETIDKIANALNIKTEILFCEFDEQERLSNSITEIVKQKYVSTIHQELISKVTKVIDEVCEKMLNDK